MLRKFLLPILFSTVIAHAAENPPAPISESAAAADGLPKFNALILKMIDSMPRDGGYSTTSMTTRRLGEAVKLAPRGLQITPALAVPSYCSGATYLVLVRAVQELIAQGQLPLDQALLKSLLIVPGQRDGEGVWGRWNANGPGTARLFQELKLGKNFTDWNQARPGDFMKIFWTNEIGKRERGHSVIFKGLETEEGVEYVRFWSSNQPRGYSEKRVPKKSVVFAVFSRLEQPANLAKATTLPKRDEYLGNLLILPSSQAEVRQMCGM